MMPDEKTKKQSPAGGLRTSRKIGLALAFPLWVLVSFGVAQALVYTILWILTRLGVPIDLFDGAAFQTLATAVIYTLSLSIAVGLPWLIKKRRANWGELGLNRLPTWTDILLAPAGFIVYFLASALLIFLTTQLLPGFDVEQVQEIGFDNIAQRHEYLMAFITLVIIAPVAEEALFRGYLYGHLRARIPIWLAMLITSAVFGAVHGQLNVAIDTFALSMIMCSLREVTGSIWAGILLHMLKNGLAFYLLFVNPSLVGIMV
ncbi:MAG TPA: type II CAAX endopeptidase family protein [Candidatus Saccharimonadales bacterium]